MTVSTGKASSSDQLRVGYIGLGRMGGPMALNLRARGFPVIVHDSDREAGEMHLLRGAQWAVSPAEVARRADVIFTCLPAHDRSMR